MPAVPFGRRYCRGDGRSDSGRDGAADTWAELDTMPTFGTTGRKKRVKHGADIVSWGGGAFFALKGNKTNEFWRYMVPSMAYGRRPERRPARVRDRLPGSVRQSRPARDMGADGKPVR